VLSGATLPKIGRQAIQLPVRLFERYRRVVVLAVVLLLAWRLGGAASRGLVVLVYGAIGAGILLRYPALGLPGLVLGMAFVPFQLGTGTGSSLNIAMLGVLGLAGLWVVRGLLNHELGLRPSPANRPWLALVVVAGLSILAGSAMWDPMVEVKDNFTIVQLAQWSLFVLAAVAYWLGGNDPRDRAQLERLTVVVLGIAGVGLLRDLGWLPGPIARFYALDGVVDRVWFVALPASLALFNQDLKRWQRGALLAMALLTVVAGYTRGSGWASGWLPSLITLSTVIALRLGLWSLRLATVFTVPAMAAFATLLPRLVQQERWSLETRALAWRGLIDLVGDQWPLGLGLAAYWHVWRGVIGSFSYLDAATGYFHFTLDPKVNMHNNYVDIYGQTGVVGLIALLVLMVALVLHGWRVWRVEPPGFGLAYAAAGLAALVGMGAGGMLGDWLIPFVYNVGLAGFREAGLGWLLLGGVVVIGATRPAAAPESAEETPEETPD
jgi:hypothetical protein